MATLFRWLMRLLIGSVLLTIAAIAILYWFATRSIPDYNDSFEMAGITAPVEIVRNNSNVPHVFGATDPDVYFGLGFAHAQDRLWQMMLLRRSAQGRLSEIFGERTLATDELMRRLDIYNLAVKSVEAQDDYTKAALRAYSAGVNAWLGEVNNQALGRGAPEFWIFPPSIAPWQPGDSLAVMKLMGTDMARHLDAEVLRAQVSLAIDPERVLDILPDVPGTGLVALPEYADLIPGTTHQASAAPRPVDRLLRSKPPALSGASNAFAAAPSRSAAGGTLLANDPHLTFTAPSIWYLARLELQSGGVIGGTIPGMPLIWVGRGDGVGWGLTSSFLDDQDAFIERRNPDNSDEVETPSGFKPLTKRTSIIQIKDAVPVTITLYWSENGPILPGTFFDLASITPPGHVASVAWTLLSPKDTSMSAALGIMRSQTAEDALAAGETYIAPSMNLMVTDRANIAMKTIGAIPLRDARHQSQGRLPTPGWREETRWHGRADYDANPEFKTPSGGILGNTNNKIIDRPFPFHVSFKWGDTQRIERWRRLMQNRQVHTRESFIEAQLDAVSPTARALLPLIGAELWFTGEAAPEGTPERQRQRALDLLANWNGEMNEHLPEPLIYAAWMRELQTRLIRDDMGLLAQDFTHLEPIFIERVFRDIDGASVWCDIRQSAIVETCTDTARIALDEALIWIGSNYGDNLESLRWGDAHQAAHDHLVLGDTPVLKWIFNIRQSTSGGDNTLSRGLSSGELPEPFQNVHGAGYRGVYDFADPDSSVFVISTGQSGHPFSRHYDDLGALWRRGEYIPMTLDPDLARAAAVGVTTLTPASQ